MVDPIVGSLSGGVIKSSLKDVSKYYEFWNDYRGKRIQIRTESIETEDELQLIAYVIEGKIKDVLSFPPGFRLVDVSQYIERKGIKNIYDYDNEQPIDTLEKSTETTLLRTVDDKFISFSSIDQIEWVNDDPDQVE